MVERKVLDVSFEGKPVEEATIKSGKYQAKILSLGAILSDLQVPDGNGKPQRVIARMDDVLANLTSPHYGQVIGRFANRITDGKFTLHGKTYQMEKNDHGVNALHNGASDFGLHQWTFRHASPTGNAVTLAYHSPDGDGGMPGNLEVTVTYTLTEAGALSLEYRATSDKDTPLNLTNHTYFNFSGSGTIENHLVRLDCPYILEVDDLLIPTGRRIAVAGGPFDFSTEKRVGADIGSVGMGYDHCYILADASRNLKPFGEVYDPKSGIMMRMSTTLPAVQFYTGNFLDGSVKCNGFGRHEGMCFETQFYPDSPNHADFPSCILKAGDTFHSTTVYAFGVR
ncbi:MAG: galactose mutarotase [Sphaerochaeta sp.]|jgi:aldose 1-epimerase|nr:galactose mutarotase [Sphaerochaeta sp.]MCH3919317.1 galactose mutarotase [Sphaerochaeta sp.]MCI2104458.1 galactose mutarotase [Sphaerochaeta sp.]